MRLSVLTPTYNYGRFLGDAIRSVDQQADDRVEHVVVDGASGDETLDVLARAPQRVIWRSEPDEGQSDALNKALALATGNWVGWLNADEFYLPQAFRTFLSCLAKYPHAALVYGDALFVDAHGRLLRLVAQHSFSSRVLRWNRCNISSCAMFVRRDAIPARGWDVHLKSTMDWDLFLEVERRRGQVVYIPRPIAAFRVHPDQITAERPPGYDEDLRRLQERHNRPSGWEGVVVNRLGEFEHRVLKVVEGGLLRELRARSHRGADLRWFESPTLLAGTEAAIEAGSARSTRSLPPLPALPGPVFRPD